MKKTLFTTTLLFLSLAAISQVQFNNRLSFEFGYDQNRYAMTDLNRFYIDSFASKTNPKILEDHIESGQSFRFALQYRPVGLFDVGLYGIYQYGERNSNPEFIETDQSGMVVGRYQTNYQLSTQALSVGFSTNIFISHLLKLEDNSSVFISGSQISIELQAGTSFSKVIADFQNTHRPMFSSYSFLTSQDFQGAAGIKYSYALTRNNFITSVGFRVGYQYLKTETVKDRLGDAWIVQGSHPINLDFSGLYYGLFVSVGK